MIFELLDFLCVFGLSLMHCLWNVCGLLGMDFSMSLIGFPQPFVCLGRSHKPWPPERDGRALLALIDCIYIGYSICYLFVFCSSTFCKSRNTPAQNSGLADPGTGIYRSFCREMYHSKENYSVLTAACEGRDIRSRDSCQVCQPETGPLLVVTSTGSKYHCSGCRTTERSKQMTITKCPICYGKTDVKAEWLNLFCL